MRREAAIIGAIVTAQASTQAPGSIREAIYMAGGGAIGKSVIAQELAGTSNKSSKEYKAALRNVQRYYKAEEGAGGQGRYPRASMREKLQRIGQGLARQSVERQMRSQGATVKTAADVKVSDEIRYRPLPELYIFPEEMSAILDAYHSGDYEGMADMFSDALFDAYDLRNATLEDVDEMDITAGATATAKIYIHHQGTRP